MCLYTFRNNIDDIVQVQYLAICSKLSNLTLEGNPLCMYRSPGEESVSLDLTSNKKELGIFKCEDYTNSYLLK